MFNEIIDFLNPEPGQRFIDCTVGGGGHTLAIADKIGGRGKVVAIDADELAIENGQKNKNKNVIYIHENFKNLSKIIDKTHKEIRTDKFNGILFDLGLSSAQLQDRNRGFSFQLDAPLDMAFGRIHEWPQIKIQMATNTDTEFIVNNWKWQELEKIIREYGEERYAKKIAQKITEHRKIKPIKTTGQLVEIIKGALPPKYLYQRIHPATRTFQALRIATNDELENLKQALPQAVVLLQRGGKIAVISYHSLEDRIVKHFFKDKKLAGELKILTKKPLRPSAEEIRNNPRSRSAKMRVAEKL